jgi:hypothetical protein
MSWLSSPHLKEIR